MSLQFLWQAKKEINDGDFTSGCRQLEVFLITREDIYLFVSSKYSYSFIWNWFLEEKVSEQNGKLSRSKWPEEQKHSFQSSAGT